MRELKFRVWDKNEKCFPIEGEIYLIDAIKGYRKNLIAEQYTGLKDKNGKEIYEGDILGGIWESGYIGYCEKCKQFQYYSCGECMACSGDVHWYEIVEDNGKLEVIGNIHENQEPIKEKAFVGVNKSYIEPTVEKIEKTLKEMKLRNWGTSGEKKE